MDNISRIMLRRIRGLVMEHKGIFRNAIHVFASILPEPTLENTEAPNTKALIRMKEWFFEHYHLDGRIELMEDAWKILIDEYEHDPHPRYLFDCLVEELAESVRNGEWEPREHLPVSFWK